MPMWESCRFNFISVFFAHTPESWDPELPTAPLIVPYNSVVVSIES